VPHFSINSFLLSVAIVKISVLSFVSAAASLKTSTSFSVLTITKYRTCSPGGHRAIALTHQIVSLYSGCITRSIRSFQMGRIRFARPRSQV